MVIPHILQSCLDFFFCPGFNCAVIQSPRHIKGHTPLHHNSSCSHQLVSLNHYQICFPITWALLISYSLCSFIHSKILQLLWDVLKWSWQQNLGLQAGLRDQLYHHLLCCSPKGNRWHGPRWNRANLICD